MIPIGVLIMTLVLCGLGYVAGYCVGRSHGLKPYANGMDMCDHLRRYSECGYCRHMVKPRA
jgi:hypothetical protein